MGEKDAFGAARGARGIELHGDLIPGHGDGIEFAWIDKRRVAVIKIRARHGPGNQRCRGGVEKDVPDIGILDDEVNGFVTRDLSRLFRYNKMPEL